MHISGAGFREDDWHSRVEGGLYYVEVNIPKNIQSFQAEVDSFSFLVSNKDAIMLWHRTLGHINFQYLKHMFPSLFGNKNSSLSSCEICQLAKHTDSVFPATPINQDAHLHSS